MRHDEGRGQNAPRRTRTTRAIAPGVLHYENRGSRASARSWQNRDGDGRNATGQQRTEQHDGIRSHETGLDDKSGIAADASWKIARAIVQAVRTLAVGQAVARDARPLPIRAVRGTRGVGIFSRGGANGGGSAGSSTACQLSHRELDFLSCPQRDSESLENPSTCPSRACLFSHDCHGVPSKV
jgi:hypothetical protein